MKGPIPRIALGLVAILVISAILMSLGQRQSGARPSASSFGPSGLNAFQVLLAQEGIATHVDQFEQPNLRTNDLVIAPYVESGANLFQGDPLAQIEKSLKRHLENGGRVLVLPFVADFRLSSLEALRGPLTVLSADGKDSIKINAASSIYRVSSDDSRDPDSSNSFLPVLVTDETFASWTKPEANSGEPFVVMASRGPGILGRTTDGLFVTNRFLDRADNAKLALQVVRGMLPEGGRVVFSEAALGEGIDPTLATVLGPWASGIRMQTLFFIAVVVITLGIRFGLPNTERRRQSGQREIIDAVSHVYERSKSTSVALDVAYESADYRIRRGLKLPAHLGIQERDRHLPESLSSLLARVDDMRQPVIETDSKGRQKVIYRLDSRATLALIRMLEAELDAFIPRAKNRIF